MSVKKMMVEIGYAQYAVDPRDAVLLLDISSRLVKIEKPHWPDPYQQALDQTPPITKIELVDYEPLALPELPAQEPAPAMPSDQEIPF